MYNWGNQNWEITSFISVFRFFSLSMSNTCARNILISFLCTLQITVGSLTDVPFLEKEKFPLDFFPKVCMVWVQLILAGSQQFLRVRAVLLQYRLVPGALLLPLGDRNPTCWASRISHYWSTGLPSIVHELQPWVVVMKNHKNLGRLFHLLIIQLSLLPL